MLQKLESTIPTLLIMFITGSQGLYFITTLLFPKVSFKTGNRAVWFSFIYAVVSHTDGFYGELVGFVLVNKVPYRGKLRDPIQAYNSSILLFYHSQTETTSFTSDCET